MKAPAYTIEEHKHRLAAWAASRAASVNGCRFKVQLGVAILEGSSFDAAFSLSDLPAEDDVDVVHARWRKTVIKKSANYGLDFTHGVAAKLINVYLKVRFVCGGKHADKRVQNLHPPIDALILQELAKQNFGGEAKQWRRFGLVRWSKFDSSTYQSAIALIRQTLPVGTPLWKIEEFWEGHQ
jgi:hypothetical protein